MKIAFVGGGTLGSVTPLLATATALKRLQPDTAFVWFGTPDGPERRLVEAHGIPFFAIPVAKLPRYPSLRWATFPFDLYRATRSAQEALEREKPDAIVSAGGFTAVPVIREAWKSGIPCAIHQLDKVPGLSNRAVAKLCQSVTTSFAYDAPPFGHVKTEKIPTPVLFGTGTPPTRSEALASFGFDDEKPCVLAVGGGTGAQAINEAVAENLDEWLAQANIIHSTGEGKQGALANRPGYFVAERFDAEGMKRAYGAADLVISRAGMGALSELAALSKAAILVPIPNNQQEENAKLISETGGALLVPQSEADFAKRLREVSLELFVDEMRRTAMGRILHETLPTDDGSELARRILGLKKKSVPM